MERRELIKELLSELSYRSNEGYPILDNKEHISILAEILDEFGLGSIKNELIENLLEAEPKSKTDDLYKSIGGTGYVLAKDYDKWKKNKAAYTGDKFTKGKDGQYTKQGEGETTNDKKTGQKIGGADDFAHDPTVNGKENQSTDKQEKTFEAIKQNKERHQRYLNNTKGIVSTQNINGIDGTDKENVLNAKEKVPGSPSSAVAEIAVGYGMSCLSENDFDKIKADECLRKKLSETKLGKTYNKEDIRKGAILGAIRELKKVGKLIEEEGLNPKTTTTGHVGGSKDSLSNTVKTLRNKGVTTINGIPIDEYEKIILEGGGGDNPTDTMVVVIDETSGKSFIYHTSNKMTSADPISNGSPYKEIEEIGKLAEGYDEGQKQQLSTIESETKSNIRKHRQDQVQYIRNQQTKMAEDAMDVEIAKRAISRIKGSKGEKNPISTNTDGKYWKSLIGHKSSKIFAKQKGYDLKNLTPEQEIEIYQNYTKHMSTVDPELSRPTGGMGDADVQIITRLYGVFGNPKKNQEKLTTKKEPREPIFDEDELNSFYDKQTDELNNLREKMNEIKPRSGDIAFAKRMKKRLHLDVAEGANPGGIPNDKFETIMGQYSAKNLKSDSDGNLYEKKGKEFFLVNSDGSLSTEATTEPLEDLDTSVVGDADTIGRCLGLKEGESIEDGIKIRVDKYDNRKVIIYDRNDKQIATQEARSKTGPGGSMQDVISYHKDFQKCLAKQTVLMGK